MVFYNDTASRFMRMARRSIVLCGILLGSGNAMATGGYLSFPAPANVPATLEEVDFSFQMVNNPGAGADAYYSHNFNFLPSAGGQSISGYIGLQSSGVIGGQSYALATIWPGQGQVLAMQSGPDANCSSSSSTPEGSVATCVITGASPLAGAMANGDLFKIYIKQIDTTSSPVASKTYEFGIQNLRTGIVSVLGSMQLANIAGINSSGLSHFLEYFGGNAGDCHQIPYTAYIEKGPVGIAGSDHYQYGVVNVDGFGPCPNRLTSSSAQTSMEVEFALNNLYGNYVISTQGELNSLDNAGSYLTGLFSNHGTVTMVTSDGNWIPNVVLPSNLQDGYEVAFKINSNYPVTVQYNNGQHVDLSYSDKVSFIRRGGAWVYQYGHVISSPAELSNLDGAGAYLNSVLADSNNVEIVTADGSWVGNINLPGKSPDGSHVFFEINSGYGVTVSYGNTSLYLPNGSRQMFTYQSGAWAPQSAYVIPDLSQLDASGIYLEDALKKYGNAQINAVDGNWVGNVALPASAPEGSSVTFNIRSGYPVVVDYGSGTASLGSGTSRTFFFQQGAWITK
jgi:hypothetical protein